ncbi:MAG: D-ribose pyranase [Spirochaetes bacterium]|nr:D-ribose pyranase [Spirochaetota bacterium]
MKKNGILNSEIAAVLARLGHTDTICVADCGLPIPEGVKRIDLALTKGHPSFLEALDAIEDDMVIEGILLADEIREKNPKLDEAVRARFPSLGAVYVSHEELKAATATCRAVIRTGEATPYANIILRAGVAF